MAVEWLQVKEAERANLNLAYDPRASKYGNSPIRTADHAATSAETPRNAFVAAAGVLLIMTTIYASGRL